MLVKNVMVKDADKMNKKIKYILIIVCVLLLTGCTVRSNITLENNGKTKEEV